jgi:hypothetical protein
MSSTITGGMVAPRASLQRLMRALLIAILALALLAPAAAAQNDDPSQHPPKMPNSTKGTKKCGKASRFGATFKVYLVKGKRRISCKRARAIVRKPPFDIKRWQYFDWTKAGNGPWSDVYYRHDRKVSIGAIMLEG